MNLQDKVQSFVGHLFDIEDWKEWYMDVEKIIVHPQYDELGKNVPVFHFFHFCLPEAGDIVTLPMKSVLLVVAYSSKLF